MAEQKDISKVKSVSQPQHNLSSKKLPAEKSRMLSPEDQERLNFNLIKAVQGDDIELIKRFLDAGANTEARDSNGMTPLIWSAAFGTKDICRLLIERGADIDAMDSEGFTALVRAEMHTDENMIRFINSFHHMRAAFSEEELKTFHSNFSKCIRRFP